MLNNHCTRVYVSYINLIARKNEKKKILRFQFISLLHSYINYKLKLKISEIINDQLYDMRY